MSTVVAPDCIASDGLKLYMHFRTNINDSNGLNTYVFLAASNPNPASISDLIWSVVSSIPQSKMYWLQGVAAINSFVCNVDSKGVFTMLATTAMNSTDTSSVAGKGGHQYDPAKGSWTNIDVSENYKWGGLAESVLVNVPNGNDNLLMHIYSSGTTQSTISFSTYDPSAHKFNEQNNTWPVAGFPVGFTASNNFLYAFAQDFMTLSSNLYLFPLNPTLALPTNATVKAIPAPASLFTLCPSLSAGVKSFAVGTNYYIVCVSADRKSNYLLTYNGTAITEPVKLTTLATTIGIDSITPVSAGSGVPSWAYVSYSSNVAKLTLTGTGLGSCEVPPFKINATGIHNAAGDGGNNGSGGNSGNGGQSSGGLSTTDMVAIITSCVVVVLIVCTTFCSRWIKKKRKESAQFVDIVGTSVGEPFQVENPDKAVDPPAYQARLLQPHGLEQSQEQRQEHANKDYIQMMPQVVNNPQLVVNNPQQYPVLRNPQFSNSYETYDGSGSAVVGGSQISGGVRNPQSYPQASAPQEYGTQENSRTNQ